MMNIYIINTPFQLYNALNYSYEFKSKSKELIILLCRNETNLEQVLEILKTNNRFDFKINLTGIIKSPVNILDRLLKLIYFGLIKTIFFFLSFKNTLIIGDAYFNKNIHLIKFCKPKSIVLLDDGFLSFFYNYIEIGKRLKINIKKIHLYSIFNIQENNIKVFTNNNLYFKSKFVYSEISDIPYFIGQPLVELGIMSSESYIDAIQQCQKRNNTTSLIYIAHRAEDDNEIEKLKTIMGNTISIIKLNRSIEFELLSGLSNSRYWFGFYSTALFMMKSIFGELIEVEAINIENEITDGKVKNNISVCYNEMKKINIKVI